MLPDNLQPAHPHSCAERCIGKGDRPIRAIAADELALILDHRTITGFTRLEPLKGEVELITSCPEFLIEDVQFFVGRRCILIGCLQLFVKGLELFDVALELAMSVAALIGRMASCLCTALPKKP